MSESGHLRRNAEGHLMRGASGHLLKRCVDNCCHECHPPIPDILYVTFTGLGGDFARYNGKNTLSWQSGCGWYSAGPAPLVLSFDGGYWRWYLHIMTGWGCWDWFGKDTGFLCDPTGLYPYQGIPGMPSGYQCRSTHCVDPQSCEKSKNAVCIVSYE